MKKVFALMSLLLVVIMVFTACGATGTTTPASTAATDSAASASSTAAAAEPTKTEPAAELTVAYITFGAEPKDAQLVSDALSKLTLEKINATVKLLPINAGQYNQQLNLMLTSNEALDAFVVFFDNRSAFVSKGSVIELDSLL
ncbi:MAG: hypothetical protein HGA22_10815, partial [Clostridiales bacterium]|nr:hypothetical protein [Clostridiales bacterium]